MIVVVI